MSSFNRSRLYNCTASILGLNITSLLKLNRSELFIVIEEALENSTQRDALPDALSDCILGVQEPPFDLPWWQKLSWSLIYAIILVVATGGNMIVMWIVLGKEFILRTSNLYLMFLS